MARARTSLATELARGKGLPSVKQRAWLASILEQLPSGVIIVEAPTGTLLFCNELAARTWPGFLPPPSSLEVVPCVLTRLDGRPYGDNEWPLPRALETGDSVVEKIQFVASNGTRTVMDVRCSPVRHDETENMSAVVVTLQEVGSHRRVEQALQASRARYENLYQNAPDMFASLTVDTEHIAQCNQTLVHVTGYSRDELLGRPVRDLHHQSSWGDLEAALERVRESGRVRDAELQLQCKNGETIDVSLSVAAIRDERGNRYYRSTWRDITLRKQAQGVLNQKQAELERSQRELQALAGRLFTAQEDERRRISRELHDDLNQRLVMLTLQIEGLYQRLPRSRGATIERLHALRDGVVELSDAVHSLAYQLHVSILDDLGLTAALESYLDDYRRRETVEIELKLGHPIAPLPSETASCLYRVAQEALRNVARHAGARHVTLTLDMSDGGVSMIIVDDGRGFEVPSTQEVGSSLGILGMQERVRLVGGRFTLVSRRGDGTHVDVWAPLPEREV